MTDPVEIAPDLIKIKGREFPFTDPTHFTRNEMNTVCRILSAPDAPFNPSVLMNLDGTFNFYEMVFASGIVAYLRAGETATAESISDTHALADFELTRAELTDGDASPPDDGAVQLADATATDARTPTASRGSSSSRSGDKTRARAGTR